MVLARGRSMALGADSDARLRFGEADKPDGAWAGRRLLLVDDRPAFALSFWCGTCGFLFERLEGANDTLSLDALSDRLATGVDDLDEQVIDQYARASSAPRRPGDYFSEEQVTTWGIDAFWSLPHSPHTPYYRTFETTVDDQAHLYEFVVPMVPPSWNDAERVAGHGERLASSSRPTAVAVSTLDVCAPAVELGPDWHTHWGLTHFLLDGHHKVQVAWAHSRFAGGPRTPVPNLDTIVLGLGGPCHGSASSSAASPRSPSSSSRPSRLRARRTSSTR